MYNTYKSLPLMTVKTWRGIAVELTIRHKGITHIINVK